jgi:hypothetical protein
MPRSGEQVRERQARESLERGGTSPKGATSPRARRNLTRWGDRSSSEVRFRSCSVVPLERSGVSPEVGWGWSSWWAAGAARSMGPCHWAVTVCVMFCKFVCVILRKKCVFPRSFRLMLADGTFFPPGCRVVPWGRASAPVGVAPEALQERGCSCKVFSQSLSVCEVLVSADIGNISAGLGGALRTYLACVCVWCIARRCSHASSPRAWARLRRSRGALCLVYTSLRRPSAGQRGEASTTPIERVANYGFLAELLSG